MRDTAAQINRDARESILESIRESLAASVPFDNIRDEHSAVPELAAHERFSAMMSPNELVEDFKLNLEYVGATCFVAASETEARDFVGELVRKRNFKFVAISDSSTVKRIVSDVEGVEIIENASAEVLFDCDLGITGAQWAIAETGTLVLESRAETHRLASLVPPVHLCIVKVENIRRSLSQVLELTQRDLSRTVTFITGASRTSDIELTLAIGVHGPAELHVIVLKTP